jgi:hypothetical protein
VRVVFGVAVGGTSGVTVWWVVVCVRDGCPYNV